MDKRSLATKWLGTVGSSHHIGDPTLVAASRVVHSFPRASDPPREME